MKLGTVLKKAALSFFCTAALLGTLLTGCGPSEAANQTQGSDRSQVTDQPKAMD